MATVNYSTTSNLESFEERIATKKLALMEKVKDMSEKLKKVQCYPHIKNNPDPQKAAENNITFNKDPVPQSKANDILDPNGYYDSFKALYAPNNGFDVNKLHYNFKKDSDDDSATCANENLFDGNITYPIVGPCMDLKGNYINTRSNIPYVTGYHDSCQNNLDSYVNKIGIKFNAMNKFSSQHGVLL